MAIVDVESVKWDPRYEIAVSPEAVQRLERRQAELNTPLGREMRARRLEPLIRRGLDESLQQFSERLGGPGASTEKYRYCWALQGLRLLGAVLESETWEKTCSRIGEGPRVAPGVHVPTREAKL